MVTIGDRIRVARERRDLSQNGLAHQAGISQALLSRIEGGFVAAPNADVIRGLARALGVTTDYIIGGMYEAGDEPAPPRRRVRAG